MPQSQLQPAPFRVPLVDAEGQLAETWRRFFLSMQSLLNSILSAQHLGTPHPALIGEDLMAEEPLMIPGPAGPIGPIGVQGIPGIDGLDPEETWLIPGATGPQGIIGPAGTPGQDGLDPEDLWPIPGPPGAPGVSGLQGIPGIDGLDGEDSWVPGATGATGAAGATGATGATGAAGVQGPPGMDGDAATDELWPLGADPDALWTLGSVLFALASGRIGQNNAKLFWDEANGRLGIGTAAPGTNIDVQGVSPTFRVFDTGTTTAASFNARANATAFRLGKEGTTAGALMVGDSAGAGVLNVVDASSLQLGTNNTTRMTIDSTGAVLLTAKMTTYNNIATAGWGVPAIYGSGRATGQTAAVASVAAYTVGAADGSFLVSANVLVTTATTHNFTVTCAYTDEGNTARTLTFTFSSLAGVLATAIINTGGAVPYEGVPMHIRCKASTAITIATTGTFTTVTYNVEGSIIQLS